MEMFERRLLSQWETSGMGEDSCCCCSLEGEAGLRRQNTLIQFLHKKEARLRRVGICFAVAALLLILLALTSLILVGLAVQGLHLCKCQIMKPPENSPSEHPSAMLTAPNNKYTGECLHWENEKGNAYTRGSFYYSNGSLVIPKNGIYRIFLQITYSNDTCKNDVLLSQRVILKSVSYSDGIELLSSVYTVSCSKKPWRKSIYGSVLKDMQANDRLFVTSSEPKLIVPSEHQVFFGGELLP